MKTSFAMAVALALLAGCAHTNTAPIEAQAKAAEAKALADRVYYESLRAMTDGAGDGPRTAAIMSAFMRQQSLAQSAPVMSRGPGWADYGLRLLDVLMRGYAIDRNADVAERQSDNNRDIQLGAFGAFEGIAGQIQAPAANVTTTQTLSGSGVIGAGSYTAPSTTTETDLAWQASTSTSTATTQTTTNTDNHAVSGSYNPVETTTYPQSP